MKPAQFLGWAIAIALTVGGPLHAADNRKPARSRSPLTELMEQQGWKTVPLEFGTSQHLYANGTVGKTQLKLVIDTGAFMSLLELRLTSGWRRLPEKSRTIFGIYGEAGSEAYPVEIEGLTLAGIPLPPQPAYAMPMKDDVMVTGFR